MSMTGIKRIASFLAVSALLALACGAAFGAAAAPAPALSQTYKDADGAYTLKYPDNWTTNVVQKGVVIVVDASVQNGASAAFMTMPGKSKLANASRDELVKGLSSSFSGFKLIAYSKTKFRGSDCIIIDYQLNAPNQNPPVPMRQRQYAFDKGDNNYAMTFTSTSANFPKYDEIFKAMAGSFTPK